MKQERDYHYKFTHQDVYDHATQPRFYGWSNFRYDMLTLYGWKVPKEPTFSDYMTYLHYAAQLINTSQFDYSWGTVTGSRYTEYQIYLYNRSAIRMEMGLSPIDHEIEIRDFAETWKPYFKEPLTQNNFCIII